MEYFNENDTLFDITEKYPETINFFVSQGFKQLRDENLRKSFGKTISLKIALKMKKFNYETFSNLLYGLIAQERSQVDSTLKTKEDEVDSENSLVVEGLLPCPVRTPLLNALDGFKIKFKEKHDYDVVYKLKAASMGVDELKEKLKNEDNEDNLADIFISAGFDLFFEEDLMGKFKNKGVFEDYGSVKNYNKDFENEEISLKDPKKHYSMIGVVPAVFLVNTNELDGREIPQSWEDILKPEFENKISLPVGDFDLFNAILVNLHKLYGVEAIKKLGRSMLKSLHPSQMVKSYQGKNEKPIVTIMPYFFTKTIRENSPMKAVWPKDGAIISPIFLLAKKSKEEKLKDIVDYFLSKEVGEILSHNGLFPSINPEVDNRIPKENKYMWVGWDYIYDNNIGKIVEDCINIFNEEVKGSE